MTSAMQRLLAAAGWDAGSIRHKQLEDALDGAGLDIVERPNGVAQPSAESARWIVRDDPQQFEKIIYSEDGEFVARVYAGPNRDAYADEIVARHNGVAQPSADIGEALRLCEHAVVEGVRDLGLSSVAKRFEREFAKLREAITSDPAQPTPNLGKVGVEALADWFYNEGHEFVLSDEEEVARALLDQFEITPRLREAANAPAMEARNDL